MVANVITLLASTMLKCVFHWLPVKIKKTERLGFYSCVQQVTQNTLTCKWCRQVKMETQAAISFIIDYIIWELCLTTTNYNPKLQEDLFPQVILHNYHDKSPPFPVCAANTGSCWREGPGGCEEFNAGARSDTTFPSSIGGQRLLGGLWTLYQRWQWHGDR